MSTSIPSDLLELADALATDLATDDAGSRDLAEQCLHAILRNGYRISPGETSQQQKDEQLAETVNRVGDSCALRDILCLWREFASDESVGPAALYATIGERVLSAGEPLIAYDILKNGLDHWPEDLRLRQLRALALARSGAPHAAAARLRQLIDEGHNDEETLGLLARTCKDQWQAATDPNKKRDALREAYRLYRQGFDHAAADDDNSGGALYAGINAASMAFLLGDTETSAELAEEVERYCLKKLESGPSYWALATLGECALINGDVVGAADHYKAAVKVAEHNYANIASTRRNAAILLTHVGEDLHLLDDWFPIPRVAVFTGHLIDQPGRPIRFAHSQIEPVQRELSTILRETKIGFGFSAAACGGDLLFLNALELIAGESHIVLALPKDAFIKASVDVTSERDWCEDFQRAIDYATHRTVVNDFSRVATPEHFEYANQVMTGLAILRAKTLETEVVPIAVWNEEPARGPGGTGSVVELWKRLGLTPRIVNPVRLLAESVTTPACPAESTTAPSDSETADDSTMSIRAMLFADAVGYSRLTEEEIPLFVSEFMGSIGQSVRDSGVTIESGNTWGDAIYFVFRSVEDAGLTALRISEHVSAIDWQSRGFNAQLKLRIGLHIGPVYRVIDPVTQQPNHTGAHVSRAARIEPIAPPGEVYASEAFAAVAAADKATGFTCDYVGVTPMAKGYGNFPTYHVRRIDA